jgi:preprotein translocase subunit SecG
MHQLILILHVLMAVAIVGLVLLQQGKGAGAGAGFGAGASQTFFGAQGSTSFLFKFTAALGIGFFASSLFLTRMAASEARQVSAKSLFGDLEQSQPATPSPAKVDPSRIPVPTN